MNYYYIGKINIIKELEDATFKEKNKILQDKLDSLDPNNKVIELTKRKKNEKRKSQTKTNTLMYNNLMRNAKFNNSINHGHKKLDPKSSKNVISKKGH